MAGKQTVTINGFDKSRYSVVISVRYSRRLRVRLWLAKQLFRTGARVLGMDFEYDEQQVEEGKWPPSCWTV